jgi:hypothetical protein
MKSPRRVCEMYRTVLKTKLQIVILAKNTAGPFGCVEGFPVNAVLSLWISKATCYLLISVMVCTKRHFKLTKELKRKNAVAAITISRFTLFGLSLKASIYIVNPYINKEKPATLSIDCHRT